MIRDLRCNHLREALGVGSDITLSWRYENDGRRGLTQKNYKITISDDCDFSRVVYTTGTVRSDAMSVELSDFKPESCTLYYWKVETKLSDGSKEIDDSGCFETALPENGFEKLGARWITTGISAEEEPASVTFRCKKELSGVVEARGYVFGLGFASLTVNGCESEDDRFLCPANSRYEKICYYDTYCLDEAVIDGENEFEIAVSGGYNRDYIRFGFRWLGAMGVIAAFRFVFDDGREEWLTTGDGWGWSENEITASSLYGGETFDATRDEFILYAAKSAPDAAPEGKLLPRQMPQIVPIGYDLPKASFPDPQGGVIYDFGENLTGVAEIVVTAAAGTEIVLEYAEMVDYSGGLSAWTNRAAEATERYICGGKKYEDYYPKTTYHGFRYIRVRGAEAAKYFRIGALRFAADVAEGSESRFECSDPLLNRVQKNARNSLISNLVSIPTDCNMRNERTPCLMDSMCVEEAAICNFDMAAYYRKWGTDAAGEENNGDPDWITDKISAAWRTYELCGDLYLAKKHYKECCALIDRLNRMSDNALYTNPDNSGCGDWCHPNDNTWGTIGGNRTELQTSLFYIFTLRMSKLAAALGKEKDAEKYEKLAEKIKTQFNRRMVDKEGRVKGGRQTSYLLPLYFGLADEEKAPLMLAQLARLVKETGKLDVGIFGMSAFIDVPTLGGEADLIFDVLRGSRFPGFGWQAANGAKSLWEEWAYTGVMHSHNHAMFASVSASFYKIYGGITATAPGFKKIRIMPVLPKEMAYASAVVDTVSGVISSRTERIGGCGSGDADLNWSNTEITVPVNVEAEVWVPVYSGKKTEVCILDGDRKLDKKDFKLVENACGRYFVTTVGSGSYNFRVVPAAHLFPDTVVKFPYTFYNSDRSVIRTGLYPYHTEVEAPDVVPTKPGDDAGEYVFDGWDGWHEGIRVIEPGGATAKYRKK